MKPEIRALQSEARAAGEGEDKRVAGLGVIYDQWAELWPGYKERILRGAVELAPGVKSYFNHDPDMVLATQDSDPPLELKDTDKGLEYDAPIPPTSYGRDLVVNLERRNVKGSSFSFSVPRNGDRVWEDEAGIFHREIKKLTLFEIGPVTDPAFIKTNAELRASQLRERLQAELATPALDSRKRKQKLAEAML